MAIEDAVRSVLSDPMNLPPEFLDYMVQWQAMNVLPTSPHTHGYEIAYDQITGNVPIVGTVVASSTTAITGSSNMYDGGPVVAEFYCPAIILPAVAGGFFTVVLFDSGGTALAYIGQFQNPTAAAHWVGATLRYRFTPSAGPHTYFIKCFVSSTTGTPAIGAGSGGSATAPAYLRITKV